MTFVLLCLSEAATAATAATEAKAWEPKAAEEVAMEAEAEEVAMEAEVVEAEAGAPMEAAEGESLCFGCC